MLFNSYYLKNVYLHILNMVSVLLIPLNLDFWRNIAFIDYSGLLLLSEPSLPVSDLLAVYLQIDLILIFEEPQTLFFGFHVGGDTLNFVESLLSI